MKMILILVTAMFLVSCNGPVSQPAETATTPAAKADPPKPESDWEVSDPETNKMDGVVTQFVSTKGYAYIHLCFQNGKPCSVPVAVVAPKSCYIEGNVEDHSYSRRVRVKFDDEKASTEICRASPTIGMHCFHMGISLS